MKSEYLLGPGKDPKIVILREGDGGGEEEGGEIRVKGKWTNRSQTFTLPDGMEMMWRYVREINAVSGKKRSTLVLEVASEEASEKSTRRLAQLVRNDETRTPGSKSCSAGNGGSLLIDGTALEGCMVKECVVVASCLMMLKKEIDRRRTIQILVITGAVGS